MNTENFLARVIPPGNYLIVSYNKEPNKKNSRAWSSRTFEASDHSQAAGFLRWASNKGFDAYYALAAFTLADLKTSVKDGTQYTQAERKQTNVQLMKVLAIDADVQRPGDGKDPSTVFPDRREALRWLVDFTRSTGMPMPNLAVNSGYGFHWYWVLETPLASPAWQPLAQALKNAMVANKWVGDTSITVDSARILRPPQTSNMKSGQPMPVEVLQNAAFQAGDYPVALIQQILQPWLGAAQPVAASGGGGTTASVSTLGSRPAHVQQPAAPMNAAAQSGIERREYSFQRIAHQCQQVKQSLASQGQGDSYPLWYRGHLTLANFCTDGPDFVHEISMGDPRYDAKNVNDHWLQLKTEISRKGLGAPRCTTFNEARRNICPSCPFWGKLNSPYALGAEDGDLPDNYRRQPAPHRIERWVDIEKEWRELIVGDVHGPLLDDLPTGGYALTFNYEYAGKKHYVRAFGSDMVNPLAATHTLEQQKVSVSRHNGGLMGDFVVAWINKLRATRSERTDLIRPYGWNFNSDGKRAGCAIAGTFYRSDGTVEIIPGGDPQMNLSYTPTGKFDEWRKAAALFEGAERADLQLLIATSFGAPLMTFTGFRGAAFHFWTKESGVGKTSAMKLATAVWGSPATMQSHKDTPNAAQKMLADARFMPRFWDELRIRPMEQSQFVDFIYNIGQGKEKARMAADTSLRPVGEWDTIVTFASNRSIMDFILSESDSTDAGAVRAFEVWLPKLQRPQVPGAARTIALAEKNYGHAGRIYLQWLAANIPTVEKYVHDLHDALEATLGKSDEERFYIASMSAVIAGAKFARDLGLFNFDVRGIHSLLCREFYKARTVRPQQTLIASNGGFDLDQLLGQFVGTYAQNKLFTEYFAKQGRQTLRIVAAPQTNQVVIHIANSIGVMRIDRKTFTSWLHRQNVPGRAVVDQMIADWQAIEHRQTLAGGTAYAAGQVWVVDIPLSSASLQGYVIDDPMAGKQPMKAAPAAALAGNQPKV